MIAPTGEHFIAVTYDVNTLPKFYIDGVLHDQRGSRNDFQVGSVITMSTNWKSICEDTIEVFARISSGDDLTLISDGLFDAAMNGIFFYCNYLSYFL